MQMRNAGMQNGEGTVVSFAKGDFCKGGVSSGEEMEEFTDDHWRLISPSY